MRSGVFLILLSMSLTPFGDALSKHLGETQSPFFIVFLRYFVAGLIAVLLARLQRRRIALPQSGRGGVVLRTALVMGAMTLLIVALSLVPLANAVGGFLIAPIVATIISVLFHQERLTLPRFGGAVISFVGALLILGPDGSLDLGTGYALAGGVLLGAFLSFSRVAANPVDPLSALAVQCLLGSMMLFPLAAFHFGDLTLALFWPAIGLGVVTAATHFLTVAAYQRAEASLLAPFFYFNLVAAVIVGLVWFDEMPGWMAATGLICIVSGGLVSLMDPTRIGLFSRRLARYRRVFGKYELQRPQKIFAKN